MASGKTVTTAEIWGEMNALLKEIEPKVCSTFLVEITNFAVEAHARICKNATPPTAPSANGALRDTFAAAALGNLLSRHGPVTAAEMAYKAADAMLAAREGK